jgi:hypothetical protein
MSCTSLIRSQKATAKNVITANAIAMSNVANFWKKRRLAHASSHQ